MGGLTLRGGGLLVHLVMWNNISYLCQLDSSSTPLSARKTTYHQVSPGGRIVPRWNTCPKFKVIWSLMFYPRHSTVDLFCSSCLAFLLVSAVPSCTVVCLVLFPSSLLCSLPSPFPVFCWPPAQGKNSPFLPPPCKRCVHRSVRKCLHCIY